MDRGYRRETRGGKPLDQQSDALRVGGIDVDAPHAPVYTDALPAKRKHRRAEGRDGLVERKALIHDLRPGSRLVVASLDRLGVSGGDIRAVLDDLQDKGCPVLVIEKLPDDPTEGPHTLISAETPRRLIAEWAIQAEATLKREAIRKARTVRAREIERGNKTVVGGTKAWSPPPEVYAAARRDWKSNRNISAADVAKKYGVSKTTLIRHFKDREMPEKRGRPKRGGTSTS